ncbi:MAG: T9SS C-terminal target domain-containing protein, partial [Chitinophagia bacterium]|nr:T9SS C-terminal target domain-containing protein [Chitinophagia bacterium]
REILTWPGTGNKYAKGLVFPLPIGQGVEMAPFKDLNSNGIYEPLQGEYPDIRGDEALWWVYNDSIRTGTLRNTKGKSLKVEVHVMAYAYSRGTLIDNVVFYQYKLYNKSTQAYNNLHIGHFVDFDLGAGNNDYIGFDSARRLAVAYNNGIDTGSVDTAIHSYGAIVPVAGMTVIKMPGDGVAPAPLANFMFFNNDTGNMGNPVTDADYDNLLRGNWLNGDQLAVTYGSSAWCPDRYDLGTPVKYAYPDDPANTHGWSQCNCNDAGFDKRLILGASDFTFRPGDVQEFVVALVAADPAPANICPGVNFNAIKEVTDTAWQWYYHPPVAVEEPVTAQPSILLAPNPVRDVLSISVSGVHQVEATHCFIVNGMGQQMPVSIETTAAGLRIAVAAYPPGIYLLRYQNGQVATSQMFIKQ